MNPPVSVRDGRVIYFRDGLVSVDRETMVHANNRSAQSPQDELMIAQISAEKSMEEQRYLRELQALRAAKKDLVSLNQKLEVLEDDIDDWGGLYGIDCPPPRETVQHEGDWVDVVCAIASTSYSVAQTGYHVTLAFIDCARATNARFGITDTVMRKAFDVDEQLNISTTVSYHVGRAQQSLRDQSSSVLLSVQDLSQSATSQAPFSSSGCCTEVQNQDDLSPAQVRQRM